MYPRRFKDNDPHSILKIDEEAISISKDGNIDVKPFKDLIGFHSEHIEEDMHKLRFSSFPKRKSWMKK